MPPEGAKWVKNPQNRKKPEKKHLWLPAKKFSKINEAKKLGIPRGFCSEEDHLLLGRK